VAFLIKGNADSCEAIVCYSLRCCDRHLASEAPRQRCQGTDNVYGDLWDSVIFWTPPFRRRRGIFKNRDRDGDGDDEGGRVRECFVSLDPGADGGSDALR